MSATTLMLKLDAVQANSFSGLSCRAEAGQVVRLMCSVQEEREELWGVLTGARSPRRGDIQFLQRNFLLLPDRERLDLFQHIGTVPHDGGLVSNLRVWENIVLPVWYHRGTQAAELEERVVGILRDLGLENDALRALMRRLPDELSTTERRWVAMTRAMLMEPHIMIYDAPFSGVEREAAQRMLRVLLEFHRARAERVSVLLLPDEPFSERVTADVTVTLGV